MPAAFRLTNKDPFDTKDRRSTGGGDARYESISRRAITCWSNSSGTRGDPLRLGRQHGIQRPAGDPGGRHASEEERNAPPAHLDITTIQEQGLAMGFRCHIPPCLTRRAADWQASGCTETLVDFPTLNTRSKFWGDDQRAAFKIGQR